MSHYTVLYKCGKPTSNLLERFYFNFLYFGGVLIKKYSTSVSWPYEMIIIANLALRASPPTSGRGVN